MARSAAAREVVCRTRQEALAAGAARYHTGKPCKHGHISERTASDSQCVACRREERKSPAHLARLDRWRLENADKIRARKRAAYWKDVDRSREFNKENYRKHAEARKAKVKKYISENKDSHSKWTKKWKLKNPEKFTAYDQNRRARVINSGGMICDADVRGIIARQRSKCAACGEKTKLTMDHIMPLALGGSGSKNNFQGLCGSCNSRKHAKHPNDFSRSRGLLL